MKASEKKAFAGNVYAGRVANVIPNLQAAFVDIGTEKNGYYYYGNARAVSDAEKTAQDRRSGDTLLLQVEKDAVGTKARCWNRAFSFREISGAPCRRRAAKSAFPEKLPIRRSARFWKFDGALPGLRRDCPHKRGGQKQRGILKGMEATLGKMRKAENRRGSEAACAADFTGKPCGQACRKRGIFTARMWRNMVNEAESHRELLKAAILTARDSLPQTAYRCSSAYLRRISGEPEREGTGRACSLKSGGFSVIEETEACVVIDVNTGKAAGRGGQKNDSENESGGGRGSGKADAP